MVEQFLISIIMDAKNKDKSSEKTKQESNIIKYEAYNQNYSVIYL